MKVQPHERLANGSVGKPYSQKIRDLFGAHAHRLATVHVDVPPDHGLVFYEQNLELAGTPTVAGEIKLPMTFRLTDSPPDRLPQEFELWLTINPDPKSLWKDLPSDPEGQFAKPDQATDSLNTLELTALAASQRGRSHAHTGKYRDDDFVLRQIGATGWHIFFVADGAGSAKYSRRGSQIAAETTRAWLEAALQPENKLDLAISAMSGEDETVGLEKVHGVVYELLAGAALASLKAILAQVEQLAATEPDASVRSFSTTYIAVLAKRIGARWFFGSFAVGDGGAGILLKDGRVEALTQPDSGEFAGQTVFLNSPGVFDDPQVLLGRTKAVFCDDFHFLAVMTDGVTDPVFHSDAQLASSEVWEAWRHRLREKFAIDAPEPGMEQALLDYLSFFEAGNHDDRTLIIAVPTGHTAQS
jgi:serine/threonine protein phosphatase PrpC